MQFRDSVFAYRRMNWLWLIALSLGFSYFIFSLLGTSAAHAQAQPEQVDEPDIVGGSESQPGAWPWQAALVYSGYSTDYYGQYCGGSLIDPEWVMTAAHCADFDLVNHVQVVMGKHALSVKDGEHISITEVILHPEWNGEIGAADVALLHLSQPSTRTVLPLDLAADGNVENRTLRATVIGWGYYEGGYADTLRQVSLPFFSHDLCRQIYYYYTGDAYLVSDGMVCAGYENGGKNVCFGDSGGPLMIPSTEAPGWKQVGIVSWGTYYCGAAEYPNVYTRVSTYEPWVKGCLQDKNGAVCLGGDNFEPDNNTVQANSLILNSTAVTHTLHSVGDTDWYKFDVVADRIYQFDTYVTDTIRGDTILWLYDTDGVTAIALGDTRRYEYYYQEGGDHDGIHWRATKSGTMYLQVESRWLNQRVDYQIKGAEFTSELYLPIIGRPYTSEAMVAVPIAEPPRQTVLKFPEVQKIPEEKLKP